MTAPLVLVPFSSGCVFLHAPEPQPTPTPVPPPKPPYFDPAAGQPQGQPLNKAGDPRLPEAFRIAAATTGDTVAIQSIDIVQMGKPPKATTTIGPPDNVKLAGIVAPTVEPGLQGAINAITNWTAGQNLDVHGDTIYPTNLDGLRVVQVFFKGRKGPYEGQTLSLNRMLVRSGWAVVDLYSPTSFDTSQWLYDEAYARTHKLGFWKSGIAVQQRVPVKIQTASKVVVVNGKRTVVTIQPTTTTTSSTTRTTQTTTTTAAGAVPPAAGTPPTTPPAPGAAAGAAVPPPATIPTPSTSR